MRLFDRFFGRDRDERLVDRLQMIIIILVAGLLVSYWLN